MVSKQNLTLTIKNLKAPVLREKRGNRYSDDPAEDGMDTFDVKVHSDHYATPAQRNAVTAVPTIPPKTFKPKVVDVSDEQPTITLTRKTQGALTISLDKVPAGSKKDFAITYKVTEALKKGEVIEIRLPGEGWGEPPSGPPTIYQLTHKKPTKEQAQSYVYLKASSRLTDTVNDLITTIDVIDDAGDSAFEDEEGESLPGPTSEASLGVTAPRGWFVRIVLAKDLSRNSTVVLNYNDATVQRSLTSDDDPVLIEAFSGPSASTDRAEVPQFPVAEQDKKITVEHAADGSGEVTFEFDGVEVKPLGDGKTVKANSAASIPAGITKDDARSLILIYTPDGDLGAGEFEFRMPSGWSAADILTSGDTKTTPADGEVKAGTTVTSTLPEYFGAAAGYALEITLVDITVPNSHGDKGFLAKSANVDGSLKQLKSRPMAFVGNTMTDNDTVKVEITPAAAYQNQDNVDFEITLTANGPMHDSEILITLPDGLIDLEDDPTKSAGDNHVRKVSASVSGVEVSADPNVSNEGLILIKTGKLNTGGKIRVRYDNVDLSDVDPAPDADPSELTDEGFRVGTRTRGFTILSILRVSQLVPTIMSLLRQPTENAVSRVV